MSRDAVLTKHRREMQRQVYLPLVITALVLVLVPVVLVFALSPNQVGTISAFMSLLLLIPTVAMCIIPYVLLVALAALTFKLNQWLPSRLVGVRSVTIRINSETNRLARRVASPVIWFNQRIAWLEAFIAGKTPKKLLPRSTDSHER